MNDADRIPNSPDVVPGVHVTVNQIVGYNITRWRKAEGMTQEELGDILGWSNATVSAAERSWDGKRIRQFDAHELAALARALCVPLDALFLPPPDDGARVRYLYHSPERDPDCLEMTSLFALLMPEYAGDTPVGEAWRRAYTAAASHYTDPERGAELLSYLEDMTSAERRAVRRDQLRHRREALLGILADIDQMATAIDLMERDAR